MKSKHKWMTIVFLTLIFIFTVSTLFLSNLPYYSYFTWSLSPGREVVKVFRDYYFYYYFKILIIPTAIPLLIFIFLFFLNKIKRVKLVQIITSIYMFAFSIGIIVGLVVSVKDHPGETFLIAAYLANINYVILILSSIFLGTYLIMAQKVYPKYISPKQKIHTDKVKKEEAYKRLEDLKELFDKGIISEKEFIETKNKYIEFL